LAASFVSFLLDAFGVERVMRLYECDDGSDDSLATLDEVARETLGVSITQAHATWQALPAEPFSAIGRYVYECGAPVASLETAEGVRLVRGASDGVAFGGVVRTFEVTEPSVLRVHAEAVEPRIRVGSCDRRPISIDTDGTADLELPLDQGHYYVWLTGTFRSPMDAVLDGVLEIGLTPR